MPDAGLLTLVTTHGWRAPLSRRPYRRRFLLIDRASRTMTAKQMTD